MSSRFGKKIWCEYGPALFILGVVIAATTVAKFLGHDHLQTPEIVATPQTQTTSDSSIPVAEEEKETPFPPDVYIEVNIPATELTLYENNVPLFRRRIAIGQGIYPTPEQDSFIRRIEWNPWWYPPDSGWAKNEVPTPPGPRNPLGLVKMPLSQEILFHGTNKDWSVGLPASHGCMRMHNRDVAALAWYLQNNFSDKNDPALRDLYAKHRWQTFKVELDRPVPVRLVYKPVAVRNGSILLYPDHYGRLWGRGKAAILTSLIKNGVDIKELDDAKIDNIVADWPDRAREIPIVDLLLGTDGVKFAPAPECS